MARSAEHDTRPDEGPATSPGRFDLLLIVVVSAYLLSALTDGRWIDALRVLLFTVAALLALRGSLVPRRTARLILVAVLAGSAIMLTLSFTTETGRGIASIWAGLVLLFAVVVIVRRVLPVRTVTMQNIYGAVSAHLMIGVAFASFFAAIDHLSGGHFFAQGHPDNTQTFQYFSFTTLTTLGYGDFTAAGNFARALADLEALTGQIFLVTLVAFLVARFRVPPDPDNTGSGSMDSPRVTFGDCRTSKAAPGFLIFAARHDPLPGGRVKGACGAAARLALG